MNPRTLIAASLAAALLAAAVQIATAQAQEPGGQSFVAPDGPVILTRVVTRSLRNGTEIVSIRHYRLTFAPDGDGFKVIARMLDARIDAPPELAALARLEGQAGSMPGFELRLDHQGRIVGGKATSASGNRETIATEAGKLIAGSSLSGQAQRQASEQLAQLIGGGATSDLPADLFNAPPGTHSEHRELALPGGEKGAIEVTVVSDGDPARSGIRHYRRTVVTELGGTRRTSREDYDWGQE